MPESIPPHKLEIVFFNHFPGDFLLETQDYSLEEAGMYMYLLGAYVSNGQGLPDDDRRLYRLARCPSIKKWRNAKHRIARNFEITGNVWRHPKLDKKIARAVQISERRAEAGRKGAKKRWEGVAEDDSERYSNCHSDQDSNCH